MTENFGTIGTANKKSLFTKKAVAKKSTATDAVDFFSRAKELYPQRLEEQERKRKRKQAKLEQKSSVEDADSKEENLEDKKQRPSGQFNGREAPISPRVFSTDTPVRKAGRASVHGDDSRSRSTLAARFNQELRASKDENSTQGTSGKECIVLNDSDGEDYNSQNQWSHQEPNVEHDPQAVLRSESVLFDDSDYSDEEFPELIQQARERERLKTEQQRINIATSHLPGGSANVFDDEFNIDSGMNLDPSVELFITSELEGTKPLRVRRKISQRLKEVRLAWCDKQPMKTDERGRPLREVIFFTWRRKRLFDVTTCGALGLELNSTGKLLSGDGSDANENIHIEAWTEESFKAIVQKTAAKQRLQEDHKIEAEPEPKDHYNGDQPDALPCEEVPRCKVIMKAKDKEPFKLMVKRQTTISKMIGAYCRAREVPPGKQISLHFDGDVLDPASTIEETELGDTDEIDIVEVHFR